MADRVFVNAWVGAGNLGDELLFGRLRERLAEHGVAAITTVSLDPADTARRHPGVDTVAPRDVVGAARAIRDADVFVLGPGGILQDDTSPWSLPYQLHRVAFARRTGTPVIGIGLGAGPLRRAGSRRLLRSVLGRVSPLVVRDRASAELLEGAGCRPTVTADLVLGAPSPAVEPIDRIVVCLRPHRPGGALVPVRYQHDGRDEAWVTAMAHALDRTADRHGLPLHFVAFEPHRDQPLHEHVASRVTATATVGEHDADHLLAEVAASRAVVAMRYHAAIAAAVACRPSVMIGYAPKVSALAERLDHTSPLLPNTPTRFGDLASSMTAAMAVDPDRRAGHLAELRRAEGRNGELLGQVLGAARPGRGQPRR